MTDIRYSELLFLRALATKKIEVFNPYDLGQTKGFRLPSRNYYTEMAATLIEDLCVSFKNDETQLLVAKLRGELGGKQGVPHRFPDYYWINPRDGLLKILNGQSLEQLQVTYRGLRRIEELREVLRRDRILDPLGILLSIQYFLNDLRDALSLQPDMTISVMHVDMDNFKRINSIMGYKAGDVVMKAYLEAVRDGAGMLGTAYRGVGDEVAVIVPGQSHQRVVELAEQIRQNIGALDCELDGTELPRVTASIGVATTPPEARTENVEILSQDRQRRAKKEGKDRVVER